MRSHSEGRRGISARTQQYGKCFVKNSKGKIRELRVDFASQRHRIFYFTFIGQTIILLHAFLKKTAKTPPNEIRRAEGRYINVINNTNAYKN